MNELLLNIELEIFSLIGKRTKRSHKTENTQISNTNNSDLFISYNTYRLSGESLSYQKVS